MYKINLFKSPNCWEEHYGIGQLLMIWNVMHSFSGTIELKTFAEGIDRTIVNDVGINVCVGTD
jgi:hypothetical protein